MQKLFYCGSKLLSSESHVSTGILLLMSAANFSVRARQNAEKDFICSQNMPYLFESLENTVASLDWWQLANMLGRGGLKKGEKQTPEVFPADTLEKLSNEHNDDMTIVAWYCFLR